MKKEKRDKDIIGWILLVLGIIVFTMILFLFVQKVVGV